MAWAAAWVVAVWAEAWVAAAWAAVGWVAEAWVVVEWAAVVWAAAVACSSGMWLLPPQLPGGTYDEYRRRMGCAMVIFVCCV